MHDGDMVMRSWHYGSVSACMTVTWSCAHRGGVRMGAHGLRSPTQRRLVEGSPCGLPGGGRPHDPRGDDAGLDAERGGGRRGGILELDR